MADLASFFYYTWILYLNRKFPTDFFSLKFFGLCFKSCQENLLLTVKYVSNQVWRYHIVDILGCSKIFNAFEVH